MPEKERKYTIEPEDEDLGYKYKEVRDDRGVVIGKKRVRVIKKHRTADVFLTEEEVKGIKFIFKTFDKDNSKSIELHELKDAMKALGLNKSKSEVKLIMEKADADGSGTIDEKEFIPLMADMVKDRSNLQFVLTNAYRIFDDGDDNRIDFENLRKSADLVAEEEGREPISDEDVRKMIAIADRKN